nr:unnamed protein product [Callosobruchus analis]
MCNKWRILHRAIDVKLEFAEDIVKAICLLHNFIRIRHCFSNEDATHTAPLSNMHRSHSGLAVRGADKVRTAFTDYFVTDGKLDCQDEIV